MFGSAWAHSLAAGAIFGLSLGCGGAAEPEEEEAAVPASGPAGAKHAACGGDCADSPVGEWVLDEGTTCATVPVWTSQQERTDECYFRFQRDPVDGSLRGGTYGFEWSSPQLTLGMLRFAADGTYAFGASYTGKSQMLHSASCRQTGGAIATCAEIEDMAGLALAGEGAGRNHRCAEDPSGGCLCTFDVAIVVGGSGTWQTTADRKLLLTPANARPDLPAPQPATYCASSALALGPELLLPGQTETGIATVFARLNCADGMQGPGEDGPDCGFACGTVCPSCSDGVQSAGEDGVDCGPTCPSLCP